MAANSIDRDSQALEMRTKEKIEEIQVEVAASELNHVDLDKLSREAFAWKSRAGFRIFVIVLIQGISVMAFAIDGTVIGGMSSLPAFREYFNVGYSGSGISIIVAAMSIGNAFASMFLWLSDMPGIGRRGVTMMGNILLLVSGIVQTVSRNNTSLIIGRLIGGMGSSLAATVGPVYISEISPAAYRGMIMGFYAACYSVGAVIIACALLGAAYMEGEWSWRMPLALQIGPPLLVIGLVYSFTPESPRFLIARGQVAKARRVIAELHTTDGNEDQAIVTHEVDQIQRSLELDDRKPWDFSTFWQTRSGRWRLWIIFLYSFFQQWNGTGMLTYYQPGILAMIGIVKPPEQLGIKLAGTIVSFLCVLAGSLFVDRVRRRLLLISCTLVFVFFFALMALFGGLWAKGTATYAMGICMLTSIFAFKIFSGLLVSVVHSLYPNEVLHYRQRAKGMGLYSFFQNCFGFTMTYGGGTALKVLQWKIYFIFIGVNFISCFLSWMYFPELRHLSLEEVDHIFETPGNPVKVSLQLQSAKVQKKKEEKEREAGLSSE